MPSTQLFAQSGNSFLVSGEIFSGFKGYVGGIQLYLDNAAPGPVYIGLPPPPYTSGLTSGSQTTITSGGVWSSGGLTDGMKLRPDRNYFVPRSRMTSGILSIELAVPAASSGGVLFWEMM